MKELYQLNYAVTVFLSRNIVASSRDEAEKIVGQQLGEGELGLARALPESGSVANAVEIDPAHWSLLRSEIEIVDLKSLPIFYTTPGFSEKRVWLAAEELGSYDDTVYYGPMAWDVEWNEDETLLIDKTDGRPVAQAIEWDLIVMGDGRFYRSVNRRQWT